MEIAEGILADACLVAQHKRGNLEIKVLEKGNRVAYVAFFKGKEKLQGFAWGLRGPHGKFIVHEFYAVDKEPSPNPEKFMRLKILEALGETMEEDLLKRGITQISAGTNYKMANYIRRRRGNAGVETRDHEGEKLIDVRIGKNFKTRSIFRK